MKFKRLPNSPFGARVEDVDCAQVSKDDAQAIKNALHKFEVLIFPGQHHLDPHQEVAFYRSIDTEAKSVWRDQVNNAWEVYKVKMGNQAGTYQIPDESGVLVLGQGRIDHYGLDVVLGGERDAYGEDEGSQVLGGGALQWHIDGTFYEHHPCV